MKNKFLSTQTIKAMKLAEMEKKFWSRVRKTKNGCWFWLGAKNSNGYGQADGPGGWETAHRVAYRYTYGDFDDNLQVLHKCDVRDCVNPEHLFLGTLQDNMRDMDRKGRRQLKISWEQVREMRQRYANGERVSEIAKTYSVAYCTVLMIVKNKQRIEPRT